MEKIIQVHNNKTKIIIACDEVIWHKYKPTHSATSSWNRVENVDKFNKCDNIIL